MTDNIMNVILKASNKQAYPATRYAQVEGIEEDHYNKQEIDESLGAIQTQLQEITGEE